jgi:hypothetical protein
MWHKMAVKTGICYGSPSRSSGIESMQAFEDWSLVNERTAGKLHHQKRGCLGPFRPFLS